MTAPPVHPAPDPAHPVRNGPGLLAQDGDEHRGWTERLPLRWSTAASVATVLALTAFAWWLRYEIGPSLPPGFPFLTFFPAVILCAFFLGTRAGLLAAVLCGAISWFQFVSPTHDWRLGAGGRVAMGFYLFITTTEIMLVHLMQRANRNLAAARAATQRIASTRALLFRELQHRVSNNLQVASSLIALQRRGIADPAARTALDDAARRIGVIGRIGRQLHDPDGAQRSLAGFLEELAHDVVDASGRDNIAISVEAVDEAFPLAPDDATPMALIVAEGIANAIEHGFAEGRGGRIRLLLDHGDEGDDGTLMRIRIRDDGKGLPPGFDVGASDSLGLKIASLLARQLGGRFELRPASDGGPGAETVLTMAPRGDGATA
jgi:two-component sensor histidine kinase